MALKVENMTSTNEKAERLAEWESDLSIMLSGSLNAWRRSLYLQVNEMHTNELINAEEARAMHERVELMYEKRLSSI